MSSCAWLPPITMASGETKERVDIRSTGELWKARIEALPDKVRECARQYCRGTLMRMKVINKV